MRINPKSAGLRFNVLLLLALFICLGCQRGGSAVAPDTEITPSIENPTHGESLTPAIEPDSRESSADGNWIPVGMFDFTFDPSNETLTYERSANTWFNITNFIVSPACPDCFKVSVTSWDPGTGTLAFDTTVYNPTDLDIGAIRAVLMFPNDKFSVEDPDLYTDWYSDGQGPDYDPVRSLVISCIQLPDSYYPFQSHSEQTRSWVLHLPTDPGESFKFQFVIEICWPGGPQEPYRFMYGYPESVGALFTDGGEYQINLKIFDLQNDIASLTIDADVLGMGMVEMTQLDENDWMGILHNQSHASPGVYKLLITATDSVSEKKVYSFCDVKVEESGVITNPQLECIWNLWPNFPPVSTLENYIEDNIFWANFYNEGWLAFDISDPSNPLPMGTPRELIDGLSPTDSPGQEPWALGNGFALWYGEYPPAPLQTRVYNLNGNTIPNINSPDYIVPPIPGVNNDHSPGWLGVFGNFAVIGLCDESGSYAAILDLSDPNNPKYTDFFGPGDSFYRCYDLTDDWIVLGNVDSLTVYARPSTIGDLPKLTIVFNDYCWNAFTIGNVFYYSEYPGEDQPLKQWVYDQNDWTEIGPIEILPYDVYIVGGTRGGNRRYFNIMNTNYDYGMAVIDFTNPLVPELLGTYWGKEYIPMVKDMPPDILITGYGEYMDPSLPHEGGIWLRDPDNPEIILGKIDYDINAMAHSVDVADNIAVIAEGSIGLLVADVSTLPAFPKVLSRIKAGTGPDMFVKLHKSGSGLAAYTLSDNFGVGVCNLSNPESPVITAILDHPDANEIDCNDQYLAVATFDGVAMYDLTDPLNPSYMGNVYPMDDNDGRVWDVNFEGNALWARTNTSIIRYDLTTTWPFDSENRTNLDLPIGWINAKWPFLVDGAQAVPNEEYGPWIYPIDYWHNFPAQQYGPFTSEAGRVAIEAPYYFRQYGPGDGPLMDSWWGSLLIYNCFDFINTYPYYPDRIAKVYIPRIRSDTPTIYGGPEFIVKDNRVYMARDFIDLVTVRLW
jgi:hypothetical protein